MSDKNNNSVIKLVGNKLFITLLIFALAIIMLSAVFNRNMKKVAVEDKDDMEIPVISEAPAEPLVEVTEEEPAPIVETSAEVTPEEISYRMPVQGVVQKEFSIDELVWNETMQDWRTHCGLDIEAPLGTEVDTCAKGTVTQVAKDETYGITVKVAHPDGRVTVYKNLEKSVVKNGDTLDEGQMIGTVGNSGSFEVSQKPHLHFEMILDEKYVNPMDFIK